tara:strand:- start:2474 stop:2755 length:282 start_codon:yes stop_codon:yes gene_type:complete
MLIIKTDRDEVRYYSLSEASSLIVTNQWGVPVQGIHSETLRRTYRDSGSKHGKKIGRDIFFLEEDILAMNYEISPQVDEKISETIQLFPVGKE